MAAVGDGPCISRRRPGRWKSQASKARHGSEVRPTVCSPATSVEPDSGSPSTPAVGPVFPAATSMSKKSLNPLRCQPMTVSGLTITRAWRQASHRQDRMTQKTLSAFRSNGRGLFRFRTATCCRRARISVWSAARSAKVSMILYQPALSETHCRLVSATARPSHCEESLRGD